LGVRDGVRVRVRVVLGHLVHQRARLNEERGAPG
jgi:hypothetical protein